jgi:hypothetical protein
MPAIAVAWMPGISRKNTARAAINVAGSIEDA